MKITNILIALVLSLTCFNRFVHAENKESLIEDFQRYEIIDLGILGTDESEALAVNNQGQVLGKLKDNGLWQIFLWDEKNGLQILDLPKDSNVKLNNSGQIIGTHPGGVFIWGPTAGMLNIGLFDEQSLFINKINDKGQILITNKSNIYLWSYDTTINLTKEFNKQFPHYNQKISANTMNNSGEVIVSGYVPYIPPNKSKAEMLLKSFLWPIEFLKRVLNKANHYPTFLILMSMK